MTASVVSRSDVVDSVWFEDVTKAVTYRGSALVMRLGRRSRHLPASVIVHADEIERVLRCVPIRLVECAHTGTGNH